MSNTYWSSDQASERSRPEQNAEWQNLDRKGLDFDGNELEIRSSSRPAACWRSWYAATLCRCLLSSMVSVAVPFLAFPLGLSCVCADGVWQRASFSSSLPCSGFSRVGGTTRRSDAVTGQCVNDILDLFVVVGFLATKRYDETRPLSVSCTWRECHLSARTRSCQLTWPSASSALWLVALVFPL